MLIDETVSCNEFHSLTAALAKDSARHKPATANIAWLALKLDNCPDPQIILKLADSWYRTLGASRNCSTAPRLTLLSGALSGFDTGTCEGTKPVTV